ncbi:acyl-CoA dehydrogenase family protein [Mycobacterium sp. 236(2023)]|uniref:acyl-CoA dehydrogenase family protein n=1 Tax=Mycobacterium sp. 236(2023) TaxID=3038163 RepID=UPI0024155557|nr:acyl-CoA dehydrogenase family protein [Mycobacterium sp. 236(2023)]MDG4664830.1 acyl-CoA/acyl-ACP dehydrogenase [Mycobacterium sp. 236(2023)]
MNLELTDEHLALRATVRRFLAEKASVASHVRPLLDDPTGSTDAVWQGLVSLGTTSLLIPVDHGGDGMSMIEAGIVCEELGAALHPGPWLSSAVAGSRALARFGAEGEQARALRSGIADGSAIVTVAVAGDGDEVAERDGLLRGEIGQVPDAAAADVLLVVSGAMLYAVPLPHPHVRVTQIPGIDNTRKKFGVSFDDAPARLLATADDFAAEALVDDIVVGWAADALGAARQILEMTVEYAKARHQFGVPIGSFQAVAHLCADMYETVELARSGILHALWAADFADRAERHRAALRVKAFAGRLAAVGDQAIQVFGGIGFTWEHDAHLYLKRLLSFSRLHTSPEVALEQLGRDLVRTAS